jgi:hypothetical protein
MRRLTQWANAGFSERIRLEEFQSRQGAECGADQEARAVLASTLPVPLHDLQASLLPRSRVQPMPRQRGQASLLAGVGTGA